jgi:O-antigen ligase
MSARPVVPLSVAAPMSPWGRTILLASLLAYPLLGTLVVMTSLSTLVASLPTRLLVALSALVLLTTRRAQPGSVPTALLKTFWFIYALRLLWDTIVGGVPGADEALFYFTVTCMLPALAMLRLRPQWFNERSLAQPLFVLGLVVCIAALAITTLGLADDRSLYEHTSRLAFDAVNPITYGHVAVSTVLAAVCLSLYRPARTPRVLLLIGALIALYTLQLTGSRGPALALVLGLVMAGIFRRRVRPMVMLFALLSVVHFYSGGVLEDRVVGVEDDPSTLERLVVQANAIEQFLAAPLTGSAYIETTLMIYPHNPFIEAAMATGIVGLLLFGAVNLAVLLGIWRMLREGHLLLPLIAMQYLVAAMLSGALYLSTSLWLSVALVLVFSRPAPRRRQPVHGPVLTPGLQPD